MCETIAAVATPIGRGGIGIIRVSGKDALLVEEKIIGKRTEPRYAEYTNFNTISGEQIDEGIVIYFQGPRSFTGEDVVEFQCHGGPVVLDLLLTEILKVPNLRLAEPGEFSKRAFLNGKIDLTQAEAIQDLINAASINAAKSAKNSLIGMFSKKVNSLNEELKNLRTYVEATIDFPDESIDFVNEGDVLKRVDALLEKAKEVTEAAKQGVLLQEGINVVIAGRPNAGKSSLLNALLGEERAIVTSIAGTTRDSIREELSIDGLPAHITDTAGLRNQTQDEAEKIGIERSWQEIQKATQIMFVYDVAGNDSLEQEELLKDIIKSTDNKLPCTVICNKTDLNDAEIPEFFKKFTCIKISAKNHTGINELIKHLKKSVGYNNNSEGVFSARRRHIDALERAISALKNSKQYLDDESTFEIAAEELRLAQNALNEILGRFTADDLLGQIFNTFCVGK